MIGGVTPRRALPLLLVLLAAGGCGDSSGSTAEKSAARGAAPERSDRDRAVDPNNPREAIARSGLELVPDRPPRSTPPPEQAHTPWPGFGRDARHTGTAPVRGPQDGTVKWKRELEGAVVPGPAIGRDGTVYAASNGGVLHALDPATGKDRWAFDGGGPYGSDLSTVPLVLRDGTILWPGPNQTLFALTAQGRERWRLRLDATVLSPALGADGRALRRRVSRPHVPSVGADQRA